MDIAEKYVNIQKAERDKNLDQLRALTMLLVILIHNIFHLGYFYGEISYVLRTYLLVEMPLFFLITGRSNCLSGKRGLFEFYSKRLLRFIIPYWVYAGICFLLNLFFVWKNTLPSRQILIYLIKWLLPLDIQPSTLPFLNLSLWFLPIYLGVIVVFPIFRWFCESNKVIIKTIPAIILFLSVILIMYVYPEGRYLIKIWNYASKILFYSFFTYLGCLEQTLVKERALENRPVDIYQKWDRWGTIAVFGFSLTAMAVSIVFFGKSSDMQINKWPPNITFLLFSLTMLCLIKLIYRKMMAGITLIRGNPWLNWIFTQYEKYFLTICLYHSFSIYLADMFINRLRSAQIIGPELPLWLLPLTLIFTVITSAFFGFCFGRIENIKVNFLSRNRSGD